MRFTHRWGGAIDTSSRFSVFFGTAFGGRVSYATGYTGLGVGAARFGGRTALDLLDGRDTEATRLKYVRSKPIPFPPSPCAGRSSSTPATASPPPTATTAAAAPGSASSTPSASASIPKGARPLYLRAAPRRGSRASESKEGQTPLRSV